MTLAEFSVKRPIVITMLTLIVVILGVVSLSRLRIDMLPSVELPNLSVRTSYPGASPEVMERLVTQPLEEIIATVPGVEELTSNSSEGNSRIRVTFVWGTNIDTAAIEVQSKIEDEINELPDDIVRPRVNKFDVSSYPVVILGISSKLDPVELTELVEEQIRYRFARVPGVAQVDIWGGYNREIRVELNPQSIKALGIPLDRILQAIRDANLDRPAGKIEEGKYDIALRAPAEFTNLDQLKNTVLFTLEGSAVTLGQIAEVKDTFEKVERIVRVNREIGLRIGIRKEADENTVEVSKRVLEEIERVNRDFPQVNIIPVINQGNFIERSIQNVARSVFYGGGLAIIVLLFFLRNIRSTVVISLAIPISIIATFTLLYFGDFTLNLMTLGGLALGVGMMVDGSIVVLENTFRHRDEYNATPDIAAINGTKEVAPAIIASTITTLVIFLPLIFVRGVSGILFKELAYVIIFSLICSLMVSLSLVPMLASRLLENSEQKAPKKSAWISRFVDLSSTLLNSLNSYYRDLLGQALAHRGKTIFISALLLLLSFFLYPLIGTELLPPSDEGEVRINGEMEVGLRLELADEQTRKVEDIVYPAVPELISSVVSVGSSWRGGGGSRGELNLALTPLKERSRSNVEIANDLRRRLSGKIPGMDIRVQAPQGQFILNRLIGSGNEGLSIEIRGYDLDTLDLLTDRVLNAIREVPGITDTDVSRKDGVPQKEIHVDRDKAADLGLSARDVTRILETAVAGTRAGEYRTEGNSYRILVQLKDAEKLSIDEILSLTLTTGSGEPVTLRNVVRDESGIGPLVIERKDQQRIAYVTANIADRDIGSVAEDVQELIYQIAKPVGYDIRVAGNFEEQKEAFHELVISLMLALVLVYMVLAIQYESLKNPLVVMFSVPVGAVGVLVTLFITDTTLNIQSYIGCIMLGGIAVNNAILLVDQAGQLGRDGMPVKEAVMEAGRRRLRPILMTTLTTIFGLLPLALGIGEGADAQAPLARAVVGGLTGSTVITLVLIPVIYSLFHRNGNTKR
ncbi:efflux RND transporter permease subunit [Thermodesulfobacteriota bacterium]